MTRRTLHILCAPGPFKESLSASEAAAAMARGVQRAAKSLNLDITAEEFPLSDGGGGFLDALRTADAGWRTHTVKVVSAAGVAIDARFLLRDRASSHVPRREAAIEVAEAIGLDLVPHDLRDPARLTTRGVGQLINAARVRGAERILVGVGNTSTVDGGVGMAAELGHEFFDDEERPIENPVGADLARIASCERSARWGNSTERSPIVIAACDVENELTGTDGAARVFGPQKGATPEQVAELDRGLRRFARLFENDTEVMFTDGTHAGAGGGLGFGLAAFCDADLQPGAALVMHETGFVRRLDKADLVLTGEGRLDAQTVRGKLPIAVSKEARAAGVPTIALVGSVSEGAEKTLDPTHASRPGGVSGGAEGGLLDYLVITPEGMPLDDALRRAAEFLEVAAERAVRDWARRTEE